MTARPRPIDRRLILERSEGCEAEEEIYTLSFHNLGLESTRGLDRCVKLRSLDVSFNHLRAVEGLEPLQDLRELKLYCNALTSVRGIGPSETLVTLLLQSNRLEAPRSSGVPGLEGLPNLSLLRIDNNPQLGDDGVSALRLESLTKLTELNASGTGLTTTEPLRGLASTLETLHLDRNSLGRKAGRSGHGCSTVGNGQLNSSPQVTPSACSGSSSEVSSIGSSGVASVPEPLRAVGALKSLTELHLGWNELHDGALRALRGLASKLSTLKLNDNSLASLEHLPALPALTELDLARNLITSLAVFSADVPSAVDGKSAGRGDVRGSLDAPGKSQRAGGRMSGSNQQAAVPASKQVARAKGDANVALSNALGKACNGQTAEGKPRPRFPLLEVLDLSFNQIVLTAGAAKDSLGPLCQSALPALSELSLAGNPGADTCGHNASASANIGEILLAAKFTTELAIDGQPLGKMPEAGLAPARRSGTSGGARPPSAAGLRNTTKPEKSGCGGGDVSLAERLVAAKSGRGGGSLGGTTAARPATPGHLSAAARPATPGAAAGMPGGIPLVRPPSSRSGAPLAVHDDRQVEFARKALLDRIARTRAQVAAASAATAVAIAHGDTTIAWANFDGRDQGRPYATGGAASQRTAQASDGRSGWAEYGDEAEAEAALVLAQAQESLELDGFTAEEMAKEYAIQTESGDGESQRPAPEANQSLQSTIAQVWTLTDSTDKGDTMGALATTCDSLLGQDAGASTAPAGGSGDNPLRERTGATPFGGLRKRIGAQQPIVRKDIRSEGRSLHQDSPVGSPAATCSGGIRELPPDLAEALRRSEAILTARLGGTRGIPPGGAVVLTGASDASSRISHSIVQRISANSSDSPARGRSGSTSGGRARLEHARSFSLNNSSPLAIEHAVATESAKLQCPSLSGHSLANDPPLNGSIASSTTHINTAHNYDPEAKEAKNQAVSSKPEEHLAPLATSFSGAETTDANTIDSLPSKADDARVVTVPRTMAEWIVSDGPPPGSKVSITTSTSPIPEVDSRPSRPSSAAHSARRPTYVPAAGTATILSSQSTGGHDGFLTTRPAAATRSVVPTNDHVAGVVSGTKASARATDPTANFNHSHQRSRPASASMASIESHSKPSMTRPGSAIVKRPKAAGFKAGGGNTRAAS